MKPKRVIVTKLKEISRVRKVKRPDPSLEGTMNERYDERRDEIALVAAKKINDVFVQAHDSVVQRTAKIQTIVTNALDAIHQFERKERGDQRK